MAEEQRCQEGHHLCANNCGFFGSPATMGLCSKCYRDFRLKEDQASSLKLAVKKSLHASSSLFSEPTYLPFSKSFTEAEEQPSLTTTPAEENSSALPGRCSHCRKKIGLTGFKCRCDLTFCGSHRYPEQHSCAFDFKTPGRESIARANPLVKAPKLDKI